MFFFMWFEMKVSVQNCQSEHFDCVEKFVFIESLNKLNSTSMCMSPNKVYSRYYLGNIKLLSAYFVTI